MNEKIKKAEGKMTKSVDRLKGEFAAIRAGRHIAGDHGRKT